MTTYHRQTGKFLAVLAQSIPQEITGEVMQGWIDNPKALKKALRSALCPPMKTTERVTGKSLELKVWKTIKLGTGIISGKEFCSELEKKDFRIGDYARVMLGQKTFTVTRQEEDVDLVVLSVAELGFKDGAQYQQICTKALELGLELCPAEVGPQLRLQYPDQPRGEKLIVVMEAVYGSDGYLDVFDVSHYDNSRWLSGECSDPHFLWHPLHQFVFRSRKPACPAGKQPLAA